jgi:hypothetical protein
MCRWPRSDIVRQYGERSSHLPEFESYILRGPMARYNLSCNSQIYDDRICCPENGFQLRRVLFQSGTLGRCRLLYIYNTGK